MPRGREQLSGKNVCTASAMLSPPVISARHCAADTLAVDEMVPGCATELCGRTKVDPTGAPGAPALATARSAQRRNSCVLLTTARTASVATHVPRTLPILCVALRMALRRDPLLGPCRGAMCSWR